jgi:hypothetical protein
VREVFYEEPDGTKVRTVAYVSYRKSPIGEWMVGDVPLRALKQITEGEWFNAVWGAEWAASARSMVRA